MELRSWLLLTVCNVLIVRISGTMPESQEPRNSKWVLVLICFFLLGFVFLWVDSGIFVLMD
ncbi:hypothetical protein ES319_1Z062600v1 [Gossypium barbadense]|uniref:Uncharacterized protein n=3 Tax=Gossypium TaxID=3633 RepID=A0A5J5NE01_GOSBA|nr:hypothetical protein ES319_1Z062600v1 [Gossypium barbadense]TYG71831.1 hypothetical protein ES288_D05G430600v1 [Gossypium darwinii]TYH74709.1 hypothetical protein ES332_D05G420700v1 [Gossypium tomentosum]